MSNTINNVNEIQVINNKGNLVVSKQLEEHDGLMAKIATQNVTIRNLEAQVDFSFIRD